jgi:hypothetical protein
VAPEFSAEILDAELKTEHAMFEATMRRMRSEAGILARLVRATPSSLTGPRRNLEYAREDEA